MPVRKPTDLLFIDTVRGAIGELIPTGQITIAVTAKQIGFTARTLQRRLAILGLSYSDLVDEVRLLRARELILQHEKLMDVATQLGYSDAGSFTRAFERWTGLSPQQYRKIIFNRSNVTQKRSSR